ncbi:hypothetical protein OS493_032287 [Desmophyllum pertusum]|uniref:Uncharacterized protein n=1 Tax=Desmophyllum pertusum TaxID=174260 RepID=A0A9W9Z8E0_9CNID|nr:hypothetical protein OS493_032287 [Desmophyllum pertusum]
MAIAVITWVLGVIVNVIGITARSVERRWSVQRRAETPPEPEQQVVYTTNSQLTSPGSPGAMFTGYPPQQAMFAGCQSQQVEMTSPYEDEQHTTLQNS